MKCDDRRCHFGGSFPAWSSAPLLGQRIIGIFIIITSGFWRRDLALVG